MPTPRPTLRTLFWLTLGLLLLCLAPANRVLAANITVTTTDDDALVNGNCTLREAIIAANTDAAVDNCTAGSGADTIVLAVGTYALTVTGAGEDAAATGDLDITSDIVINGASRTTTIITAAGLSDRAFHVVSGSLTLNDLTVNGGAPAGGNGGAILHAGTALTLDQVNITGGQAVNGGALAVTAGTATITETIISGGVATGDGGALFTAVPVTLTRSTLAANTANRGGGAFVSDLGNLTAVNSTISGNGAAGGGSGVFAATTGGGSNPTVRLANVTLTLNTNGGVAFNTSAGGTATLQVRNTILAGNTTSDCTIAGPGGTYTTEGNNLFGNVAACLPVLLPSDQTLGGPINTVINTTLADNGGGVTTHALALGSPAIDTGNATNCTDFSAAVLTTDQRGNTRPTDGNADSITRCDIGAFETNIYTLSISVNAGPGAGGSVLYNPPGLNCATSCNQTYLEGTVVNLSLTLNPGSTFTGFSGDADCTDNSVTMLGNRICIFNVAVTGPTATNTSIFAATASPTPIFTATPAPTNTPIPTPLPPTPVGRYPVEALGGSFTCEGWTLTIPPNIVPNASVLHCRPWDLTAAARFPAGYGSLLRTVNIQLYDKNGVQLTDFPAPIRVCNVYEDPDIAAAGGNPRNFFIANSPIGGRWTILTSTYDFNARRVCAETTTLSLFDMIARIPTGLPVTGDTNPAWQLFIVGLAVGAVLSGLRLFRRLIRRRN